MRKERTLLILGIVIAFLPFLGFPNSWREVLFVMIGLSIIYLAYLFYLERKARLPKETNRIKTFVDSENIQQ